MSLPFPKYTIYKHSKNQIMIELDLKKLDDEDQVLFFGNVHKNLAKNEELRFIQKIDFEMDFVIMVVLEINPDFRIIPKGEYPVRLIDNKVQVIINMAKRIDDNEIFKLK